MMYGLFCELFFLGGRQGRRGFGQRKSECVTILCHINIPVRISSQSACGPAGSEVMEILMSLQEMLPAAVEGGTDLSSLLLVLLHQRHFSAD